MACSRPGRCSSGSAASSALAADPAALGELAREAEDSGGARVLPGLAGLGAPWWRPNARAVLAGISGGTTGAQVARAALEGIAWRVADIVEAIRESVDVDSLRVDGGLTNEPLMLELQADAIGAPVEAAGADATVLGAAALAAVGSGTIGSLAEAAELLPVDRAVEPHPRRRLARRPSTSAGASSCRRPPRSTRSRRTGRGGLRGPRGPRQLAGGGGAAGSTGFSSTMPMPSSNSIWRIGPCVALVHAEHPGEASPEQNDARRPAACS